MQFSEKAKALGCVSINDYYKFLTGKDSRTKRLNETEKYREWLLGVWRPFSKTITNEQWEELPFYRSIVII